MIFFFTSKLYPESKLCIFRRYYNFIMPIKGHQENKIKNQIGWFNCYQKSQFVFICPTQKNILKRIFCYSLLRIHCFHKFVLVLITHQGVVVGTAKMLCIHTLFSCFSFPFLSVCLRKWWEASYWEKFYWHYIAIKDIKNSPESSVKFPPCILAW